MPIPAKKIKWLTCPKCKHVTDTKKLKPLSKVQCANCEHRHYVPVEFGPYHLYRRIGTDAVSTLFKAHDATNQEKVILRIARENEKPEDSFSLQQMAERFSKVTHKSFAAIRSYGKLRGREYVELANIPGDFAGRLLNPQRKVHQHHAILNALELTHCMMTINEAGLPFGQICQNNLIISRPNKMGAPRCVLLFFGHYDAVQTPEAWKEILPFMSPEKIFDPSKHTWASDIYSLGGIIHFLLTGEIRVDHAFFDPLAEDKPLQRDLERKGIDSDLAFLITQMLSRESKERLIPADQLITMLKNIYMRLTHTDDFALRTGSVIEREENIMPNDTMAETDVSSQRYLRDMGTADQIIIED